MKNKGLWPSTSLADNVTTFPQIKQQNPKNVCLLFDLTAIWLRLGLLRTEKKVVSQMMIQARSAHYKDFVTLFQPDCSHMTSSVAPMLIISARRLYHACDSSSEVFPGMMDAVVLLKGMMVLFIVLHNCTFTLISYILVISHCPVNSNDNNNTAANQQGSYKPLNRGVLSWIMRISWSFSF